jgi:hypothetical protein
MSGPPKLGQQATAYAHMLSSRFRCTCITHLHNNLQSHPITRQLAQQLPGTLYCLLRHGWHALRSAQPVTQRLQHDPYIAPVYKPCIHLHYGMDLLYAMLAPIPAAMLLGLPK